MNPTITPSPLPVGLSSPTPGVRRRTFLRCASALVGATALRAAAESPPGFRTHPVRYPDPDILVLDSRFARYKLGNTAIQRLHTGDLWAEGPAWDPVGQYLLWSDIPNDIQRRWLQDDGHVSVFRQPAGNSNGNTFDFEGRQISCQHGHRRVVRYERRGGFTVLADAWNGKPLNAPNDAVVHPDGGVWFTDPGYGSMMNYEGKKGALEIKEAVYRIDPKTAKLDVVTDAIDKPNGLCFSPDYRRLYVADTGQPRNIMVWDTADDGRLRNGRVFVDMVLPTRAVATRDGDRKIGGSGGSDGIRCDVDGNLWSSAGWVGDGYDGVHIFAPDGTRIGLILLPEICSNLCFGGPKRNRLFMTASQSVYAVYVETQGAHIC